MVLLILSKTKKMLYIQFVFLDIWMKTFLLIVYGGQMR